MRCEVIYFIPHTSYFLPGLPWSIRLVVKDLPELAQGKMHSTLDGFNTESQKISHPAVSHLFHTVEQKYHTLGFGQTSNGLLQAVAKLIFLHLILGIS